MQETLQVMPARCSRCGELFDLRYDLADSENENERFAKVIKVAARTKMCWNCRV